MTDHDRNSLIDNAAKNKLFDSSYDHIVLKESEQNRRKLLLELRKVNFKHKRSVAASKTSPLERTTRARFPSLATFVRLVKQIRVFFSSLIAKRVTIKFLNSINNYFYDHKSKKIKPGLPLLIYDKIFFVLADLKSLFYEVRIDSSKIDFNKKIFLLDFIYPILSPQSKEILSSINIEFFYKILSRSNSVQDSYEQLYQTIDLLKQSIIDYDTNTILKYTHTLEKLFTISEFNFYEFFTLFDNKFRKVPEYKVKFKPIFAQYTLLPIKTLDSFINTIMQIKPAENIIDHFIASLNNIKRNMSLKHFEEENNMNPNNQDLVQDSIPSIYSNIFLSKDDIYTLYKKLSFINTHKVLEYHIKIISNDYSYNTSPVTFEPELFLNQYIRLLVDKQLFLFEKSKKTIKSSIRNRAIVNLFNINSIEQLIQVDYYNANISSKLIDLNLPNYTYVIPLSIFKTFLHTKFKAFVESTIRAILEEGDFLYRKDARNLNNNFLLLKGELTRLTNFELGFSNISQKARNICDILAKNDNDNYTFSSSINSDINEIEQEVLSILIKGTLYFDNILNFLIRLKQESAVIRPSIINNLATIKDSANAKFIEALHASIYNISQLQKIMHFYPFIKKESTSQGLHAY